MSESEIVWPSLDASDVERGPLWDRPVDVKREVIEVAQAAFIVALRAGVDEDSLVDSLLCAAESEGLI